ncbi:Fcf2 pre-rRNA processing-domain-containing protein [Pisolithus albus]|nr:Fcf2 pre-rRNA processing-domain-containing protein [Pisolithus albus]
MTIIDKGKQKATDVPAEASNTRSDRSDEDSETSSVVSDTDDNDSSSSSESEITQEYLNSLLEKAKQNAREEARMTRMLQAEDGMNRTPLPPLDPGKLPPTYLEFGESRHDAPSRVRDPDQPATAAMPAPPPEPKPAGLTRRQMKAAKQKTAGPDWFDLPAPAEADLPRLYREVEALRLRNQLDPKRFYRKDEGEGKGIKGLPKHFAIGTIVHTTTPFGTASSDNLQRAERKRTLVDELVD